MIISFPADAKHGEEINNNPRFRTIQIFILFHGRGSVNVFYFIFCVYFVSIIFVTIPTITHTVQSIIIFWQDEDVENIEKLSVARFHYSSCVTSFLSHC